MKRILVKFDQADQIINFVRIMNRFECDADVKCGSRMVDAKSIVGVLSLAKSKTVELILHTDDCDQLMDTLSLISTYKEPGPQQMLRTGFLCARERTFSFSYSFSFKEKLSMILFMLRSMWCSISFRTR